MHKMRPSRSDRSASITAKQRHQREADVVDMPIHEAASLFVGCVFAEANKFRVFGYGSLPVTPNGRKLNPRVTVAFYQQVLHSLYNTGATSMSIQSEMKVRIQLASVKRPRGALSISAPHG